MEVGREFLTFAEYRDRIQDLGKGISGVMKGHADLSETLQAIGRGDLKEVLDLGRISSAQVILKIDTPSQPHLAEIEPGVIIWTLSSSSKPLCDKVTWVGVCVWRIEGSEISGFILENGRPKTIKLSADCVIEVGNVPHRWPYMEPGCEDIPF